MLSSPEPQIGLFPCCCCCCFVEILVSNNKNPDLLADVVSIDEGHKVVGEGHGVADNEKRV